MKLPSEETGELFIIDYPLDRLIKDQGDKYYTIFFYEIDKTIIKKISDTHYKIIYVAYHLLAEEYGRDPNIPQYYEYDLFIQET